MFSKMSLGLKIAAGFATILVLALLLGILAYFSTSSIVSGSETLSKAYMPFVEQANILERNYLQTMSDLNTFTLTGNAVYKEQALANLAKVKAALNAAEELVNNKGQLSDRKATVESLGSAFQRYEEMINQAATAGGQYVTARDSCKASADKFLKEANKVYNFQKSAIVQITMFGGSASTEELVVKINKLNAANDAVSNGNQILMASFKLETERDEEGARKALKKFPNVQAQLNNLKQMNLTDTETEQVNVALKEMNTFKSSFETMISAWVEVQAINQNAVSISNEVLTLVEDSASQGIKKTTEIADNTTGIVSTAANIIIFGLLGTMAIGIFMAFSITGSITKSIHNIIHGLESNATQVHAAAGQVASASHEMAEGANNQASSIEEVSSSLIEMSSMTKQNADNAKEANILASNARDSAESGNEAMEKMADAINRIKNSADETAKIVKTIDEIAFQTNLLALNAAVEAARAGEAGKGFAVVAEEVRNLAQRSAEAARNTSELILESQNNSGQGVKVTEEVAVILKDIVDDSNKVSNLVSEVASASEEQAEGIEQINAAVSQMDQVTQSNAANAEESSSSSQQLSSQASQLTQMVKTLVDLVDGSKNGSTKPAKRKRSLAKQSSRPKAAKAAIPSQVSRPAARKVDKKVEVRPEQVIPFDDDDLADF